MDKRLIIQYLADYEMGKLKKPNYCKVCGRKCKLIWHAQYMRKLITLSGIYDKLPIKRLFCPLCNHTFALIPNFIMKFCRYGKDIITLVKRELAKKKISFSGIVDKLSTFDIHIETSTLYFWKDKRLSYS